MMIHLDNDIQKGMMIDKERVNDLLTELLATKNHQFIRKFDDYIDKEIFEPNEKMFELMLRILRERKM